MDDGNSEARDESEERGLERGLELGCAALRRILQRILAKRFSAIPLGTGIRIEQAPIEQLEEWIDRAMDVDSVESLFEPQAERAAPPAR
jgi:hypothetical protein